MLKRMLQWFTITEEGKGDKEDVYNPLRSNSNTPHIPTTIDGSNVVVETIHRLSIEEYNSIAKRVPSGVPKTDIEASFMCGANMVLKLLREGYVIEAR